MSTSTTWPKFQDDRLIRLSDRASRLQPISAGNSKACSKTRWLVSIQSFRTRRMKRSKVNSKSVTIRCCTENNNANLNHYAELLQADQDEWWYHSSSSYDTLLTDLMTSAKLRKLKSTSIKKNLKKNTTATNKWSEWNRFNGWYRCTNPKRWIGPMAAWRYRSIVLFMPCSLNE